MTKKGDPLRRCILTGRELSARALIRLVADPEGKLIPDISGRLPGRGLWVQPSAAVLGEAIEDGRLVRDASRSLKRSVQVNGAGNGALAELSTQIDTGLQKRCLGLLGMARGAGAAALGFEKVMRTLKMRKAELVFIAADAGGDSLAKIEQAINAAGKRLFIVELFDRCDLGDALGVENAVFAAITNSGFANRISDEVLRLAAFRGKALRAIPPQEGKASDSAMMSVEPES